MSARITLLPQYLHDLQCSVRTSCLSHRIYVWHTCVVMCKIVCTHESQHASSKT
uniref:Uncharacterized protein n=1 Tax=Arundo donax TaxID=35708 RepID=A0A0A9BQD1_ARUDO